MSVTSSFISDTANGFSSSTSKILRVVPHSRSRWRMGAYVSHALCSLTSAASPVRSSSTSMSSSRSSSTWFQYCNTLSSSVHSRTTTHTGRFCNGFIASAMSPSVAAPSDAITSTTRCPAARSTGSSAFNCAITCRICSQSGVRPVGPELSIRSTAFTSSSGAPLLPNCSTCGEPPPGGLSIRNSVGAPRCAATRACQRSASPSSSQREVVTIPSRPAGPKTMRWPSVVCIDPELSMIQMRRGMCCSEPLNSRARPPGISSLSKNPSVTWRPTAGGLYASTGTEVATGASEGVSSGTAVGM
mmetsp:Transcript_35520/g.86319  ORF Transcript_35520/g.86319 Transcript_35520/m.86319 type:complete len:301 (+) Transcript_35520:736-1638(+)